MSFFSRLSSSSASTQSAFKGSSTMSNMVTREVARVGVDYYRSTANGRVDTKHIGGRYPYLAAHLGNDEFKRYSTEPPILSLLKIHYCQYKLEQLKTITSESTESNKKQLQALSGEELTTEEAQGVQKMRGIINHDYLVLEFQSSSAEKLYISAQKRGGEGQAGIYVLKAEPAECDVNKVLLLTIDCRGVPMRLDSLQSLLLEADTPHYDLRDHNCWDYATKATKLVLEDCIDRVNKSRDEVKTAQLKKAHRDLEANLNNKSIVKTLVLGATHAVRALQS